MTRGLIVSAFIHLAIFLLVVFGLPTFFQPERLIEPTAISVEILPITEISNPKPTQKQAEKEPAPAPPKPKPPEPKPIPPKPKPPKPAEPIPAPAPVIAPKPTEEKKTEPKEPPKDQKPPSDDDSDLKKLLEKLANEPKPVKEPTKSDTTSENDNYDPRIIVGTTVIDSIRSQITKCWNPPIGAKDAQDLAVILRVSFEKDGSVVKVYLHKSQEGRYNSDTFFRAAADSAMRAVQNPNCVPIKGLPVDKYQGWKFVELNFDPRDALY